MNPDHWDHCPRCEALACGWCAGEQKEEDCLALVAGVEGLSLRQARINRLERRGLVVVRRRDRSGAHCRQADQLAAGDVRLCGSLSAPLDPAVPIIAKEQSKARQAEQLAAWIEESEGEDFY
jgi:hypothetical protein